MKYKKLYYLIPITIISTTQPAFAYIDPGSGSAIMTVIIGFFVAIGVTIKTFWYKIRGMFGFNKINKTVNHVEVKDPNKNNTEK